jgi:hypothetical protein
MNKPIKVILSEDIKVELLEKQNKACNTNYKIKDIERILEYNCTVRNITLIEIIFNDYVNQRFIKDSFEIDNFL